MSTNIKIAIRSVLWLLTRKTFWIVFLSLSIGWLSCWFNEYYVLRSPVILQVPWESRYKSPVRVTAVQYIEAPTMAPVKRREPMKVTDAPKKALIDYDKIRQLESQKGRDLSGLHGRCVARGGINEIGYDPYNGHCFDSDTEQRATFDSWVAKYVARGYTVNEMLCTWNTGSKVSNCQYAKDYNKI